MIPVIIQPVRAFPPADDRTIRADDIVVLQGAARVNGQHLAEDSPDVAGVAAALVSAVALACPTPGVMVVLVAVSCTVHYNIKR